MESPDSIGTLWPLILGWLLGLLSPAIVDSIKKEREAEEIRTTVLQELKEIRYQLSLAIYLICTHDGIISRSNFSWLYSHLSDFKDREKIAEYLDVVNRALALSDTQISVLALQSKGQPGTAPALKKIGTPALDSKFSSFTYLDKALQSTLMEIHLRMNILNQIVDEYRVYFQLTFSPAPDVVKEAQIVNNINLARNSFRQQAVMIVDSIKKIEQKFRDG